MRLAETFRYETAYRLRSASTWIYGAFLFLIAFYVVHVSAGTGSDTITTNAPFRVAEMTVLFCGLLGILVTAGLFSDAALRDRAARMEPLLFTTRLRPAEYLRGRFLAALLVHAILVLAIPLGLWVATLMPYLHREAFGPDRVASYLQPLLLFTLPNLVLVGAILFTIAVLSRRAIVVYLGAIAIFVGYLLATGVWSRIGNPLLSALADPFGINALKAMTKYWTASERNVRTIGFPTLLLWNRLLWLAIAAGVLALLQRAFGFTERFARGRAERRIDAPAIAPGRVVPKIGGVFGRRTRMLQTLAITRDALADVVSGWPFRVAFVAAVALVPLLGWDVGETIYETITWPVTHLVAGVVLAQRVIVIPWLVIVLFAGELVWKDRDSGAAEIADAVPVRTGTVLLGRFLALAGIIALMQCAFMLGGMLLQALHGYYVFEPMLYVKILFGIKFVDFIILAALAMTVHVLVNHKYVGHLLMILVIAFNYAALDGVHHLLVYDSGPSWTYSEMNGFAPFVAPFVAFKLYWAAWALLLGVVAFLFWARGPELGIRKRLAAARARFTPRVARLSAFAFVLIAAAGGFIFYNTNVLNEYLPPRRAGEPQAQYERRYGRYRNLPQPQITAADLRIELYPDETAADMSGSYRLVNESGAMIPAVHVATQRERGGYEVRSMSFDRAAKPRLVDSAYGYRIFDLERPLAPGESLQFHFSVAYRPRGFTQGQQQTKIVRNGTYFDRLLLPFIGYQALEVTDEKERKKYGLPPRPMPEPGDADAARYQSVAHDGDRAEVEVIVGTPMDQTAIVPGVLRRSWTANGRRYFHYGSRRAEPFTTAVFAANYAVSDAKWRDVPLQVFHHPPHRRNVGRMLNAMTSALDYYTASFGPYPYRELRIVEITPYSGINGRAFPSAAAFSEHNFINRDGKGQVDLTFFGVAHEVAHQWWGGEVRPAYAKGRSFVSETLANYSAMMVTEKALGPAEARRVYDYQMERYLTTRAETGRDVPLLEAEGIPHVAYGKGAVALYTLREQLGEEAVNGALRRFLEKYRRSGPPYATSLDLYAELRAVTPPSLHGLLTDLFETMTLWDLKTQSGTARRLPDGRYEVTLDVRAQKVRADSLGRETPTPMDDVIEVACFAGGSDAPIYRAKHRIRSGQQTLRIIVPRQPDRAGLGPQRKLIEREREDNVITVRAAREER